MQPFDRKQHQLVAAQQENEELEANLTEAETKTILVQNITYTIQGSAISGEITSEINSNGV